MILHSLIKSRQHVWSLDPGLDRSDLEAFGAAWKAFHDTGDVATLPIKDGATLAVFILAPLTRRQFTRVFGLAGLEQVTDAVAYGLQSVSGFQIDGAPVQLERTDTETGRRLTSKSLDAIFDPVLFAELAGRIVEISRIDPTRG